jgi:hypothetical protein
VYADPRTHLRCREAAERLRDEDHAAPPDHFQDSIGVRREAGLLVVAGQIDRDRVVARGFDKRHDTMPVPRDTTGTGNENECHHATPPSGEALASVYFAGL